MKHVYEKDLHEQGQAIIPASHFGLSMAAQFSSCNWDSQPTQYDYSHPPYPTMTPSPAQEPVFQSGINCVNITTTPSQQEGQVLSHVSIIPQSMVVKCTCCACC